MKLDSSNSDDEKQKFKVVRMDNYTDVPGHIVTADEDSGVCNMRVGDETKTLEFGEKGIRLVVRRR